MVAILVIFALVHSGGAGLRAQGEKLIGERAYRVLFAGISLPLAVSAVVCPIFLFSELIFYVVSPQLLIL